MGSRVACTASLCSLIALVGAGSTAAAPRPDPPPLPPPAPPPAAPPPAAPPPAAPPPAAVQPAPPAAAAAATAARRAARRRAAAARARRARIKAQRLRAARAAAAEKAARRKLAAGRASARSDRDDPAAGSPESPATNALPVLLAGLFAGAVLLGIALTPAWAVPWARAARALEGRREEVAVLGAMGLFATGLFFLFVTVVAR